MASRTIPCHPKAFPRSFLRRPYPTMSIYSSRPNNLNTSDITLTLVQADNMTLSTVFQLHWDDILIPNVLPYLSVKDLLLLRATCTEGRDLVHSFLQNLRRLDLSFSNIYSKFTVEAFQIVTSSQNIRHFNLRGSSLRWLQDSVVIPPLLTNSFISYLDLSSCHGLTEGVIYALATSDCVKQLKILKLSGCGWAGQEAMTNLFTATSALEHVDLTGCWACGDASVTSALVLHNPHLKSLSLANIYGLRDDSIEMLARQSSLLECLDLRECYRLTNGSIFMLVEYSPALKSLKIRGCRDLSDSSLRRIMAKGVDIDKEPPRDYSSNFARDLTSNFNRHLNLQI